MKNDKKARLIEGPVGKTLIKLTIPMIFGIISMVTFNLADTFFVGRLGTLELAALSFTFPVVLVIQSLAMGLGIGASAVISRAIGEGNHDQVKRLTTDSLVLSVLLVAFFAILGMLTIEPLFRLLGATPQILPLIKQYMRIWYLGVIFVIVPMVGNNAIRASGDTKTPGIIMMTAAGINLIMDPILIFGLGPFPRLEITGAALATVFGRAITLVLSLVVLIRREKMITFTLVPIKTMLNSWKQILYIGLPTAGTRIVIPLGMGVITRIIAAYGPESVAGFGVCTRIEFFAIAVVMALASVIGPFAGQNWGAGKIERVQLGLRYSKQFSMGWGLFLLILLSFLAKPIVSVFNNNPKVISSAVLYLRIVPLAYGLQGVLIVSASVLNVLKKPLHAASLSVLQMFFLYIPLAYAGSALIGLPGIFTAIAVSYLIAGTLAHFILGKMIITEQNPRIKIVMSE